MRNFKLVNLLLNLVLYFIFLSCICSYLLAQIPVVGEIDKFQILVKTKKEGFKLTCKSGCAWKTLSFTTNKYQPQAVDQWGMISLPRTHFLDTDELSNFLFTIERNEKGVSMHGIEGTAWTNLSFSCRKNKCHQFVDEMGMTTLK